MKDFKYQIYGREEFDRSVNQIAQSNHKAKLAGIPGNVSGEDWILLKRKYLNQCVRCRRNEVDFPILFKEKYQDGQYDFLTVDHIIPLSDPRCTNTVENIQPLCMGCQGKKGVKETNYKVRFFDPTLATIISDEDDDQ